MDWEQTQPYNLQQADYQKNKYLERKLWKLIRMQLAHVNNS